VSTGDLILVTAGAGAVFSAVCALLAAFADWPRQARHVAGPPPRPGADVPTPPGPWRTSGAVLPDTRPLHRAPVGPPDRLAPPPWDCGLCYDGREVIGPTCIWCGCRPVMQP